MYTRIYVCVRVCVCACACACACVFSAYVIDRCKEGRRYPSYSLILCNSGLRAG